MSDEIFDTAVQRAGATQALRSKFRDVRGERAESGREFVSLAKGPSAAGGRLSISFVCGSGAGYPLPPS
jgi:hypothetical protein